MPITVQIDGLKQFEGDISRASVVMQEGIHTAMRDSVIGIQETARQLVRYKTGTLRRSILWDVQQGGLKGITYQDSSMASYGAGIEYGTKAHDIYPVNKKALASRQLGIVFGKHVRHPGNRAFPYMTPALERNIERITQNFSRMLEKVALTIAGKA